jgi:hypothetical protein
MQAASLLRALIMKKKCPKCRLVNFSTARTCARCGSRVSEIENIPSIRTFLNSPVAKRMKVFLFACVFALSGFYISLILSAKGLHYEEKKTVEGAIRVLEEKGFSDEVFLLKHFTVFRRDDNWLNASIEKENAYAATNFPFEIMTLYADFFLYPKDDIERASILLHEAKHLQGKGEKEAYEFVWKNRNRLGWTKEKYRDSIVWDNVRRQTRDHSPNLFVCEFKEFNDCTD